LFHSAADHLDLHSFPTRRSSDLFDQRKQLLVDEANAIGTAMLRAEMLPDSEHGKMLALLREYVDARMHFSEARIAGQGIDSAMRSEEHTSELQSRVDLVCRLLLE